jgi:hypothetical protein
MGSFLVVALIAGAGIYALTQYQRFKGIVADPTINATLKVNGSNITTISFPLKGLSSIDKDVTPAGENCLKMSARVIEGMLYLHVELSFTVFGVPMTGEYDVKGSTIENILNGFDAVILEDPVKVSIFLKLTGAS